jgi:hypothetical protein
MYIKVYTNPATHQEVCFFILRFGIPSLMCLQIPLKRFYRYTLMPSLTFDAHGYVPLHASQQRAYGFQG